jgi:hypothetical protein
MVRFKNGKVLCSDSGNSSHIAVPNTMLQQRQEDLLDEFEHEGGLGAEVTELQQEIPKSINS